MVLNLHFLHPFFGSPSLLYLISDKSIFLNKVFRTFLIYILQYYILHSNHNVYQLYSIFGKT
jgi:hypothetical protein